MSTLVITGAKGRLGRIVAAKFQQMGRDVVGVDSNAEDVAPIPCYEADLTDEDSVSEVFEQIRLRHGEIDVLIHTVGMWDGHPTVGLSLDRWKTVLDVNLTSTFLVFREVLRFAKSRGESTTLRLIAMASGQGADRGLAEQAAYSAAKAGVIRLVESIAAEYPERNVTAHAIAPSMILFDGMQDEAGISVHEIANLCAVLAGDAGGLMTGTTIRAYGSVV